MNARSARICKQFWLLALLLLLLSPHVLAAREPNLSEPTTTNEQILLFALKAVKAVNTYGYENYQARLRAAAEFFTHRGWQDYMQALDESKNLHLLRTQQMHVCATPQDKGTIISAGVLNKVYQWRVVIPAIIQYQNEETTIQQLVDIRLTIVRTIDTRSGIGIDQYIAIVKR